MLNNPNSAAPMSARALSIDHVDYGVHRWKGILCSSCELFTSKELSFVPAASFVKTGGFAAVRDFYCALGTQYEQALSNMLAFDALVCNTDRHMSNYGFMVDNATNEVVGPAFFRSRQFALLSSLRRRLVFYRSSSVLRCRAGCSFQSCLGRLSSLLFFQSIT